MSLDNGTILITGATSGFGAATARLLARKWPKANFWLTGRRGERLESLATELGKDRVRTFRFDIRDRAACEKLGRETGAENISVLLNNAGLAAGLSAFQESDIEDWERMIDTNLKGLLYVTRAIVPHMITRKAGHIVNLGSVAGRWAYPRGHVYNATKFGVRALSEALRLDLLGTNVRVTNIEPGMAETEFSLVRFAGDKEKAESVYKGMKPLTAEDVAESIYWCLERPAHVNVQELVLFPTAQASVRDVHREQE